MTVRYPRFVTRQSLAALITLLLLAFLAVALIFPWHLESVDISNSRTSDSKVNVNGRLTRQWTWKGMYVQVTSKDPHSHLKRLYPENRIVAWDDLPAGSKHVHSAFVTSQVFVILALAFALALILFLFFGLIVRRTATACARVLRGNGKWIAVVFALCAFVFALLAWTLFFRFPSALGDDGLCPAAMFDDLDDPLWCRSRKIAGMGAHHDVPFKLSWTGTNQTVNVDAHFTWAPSVGWFFCVFSSGLLLPIIVFTACVRTAQEEERLSWRYHTLDRNAGSVGEFI
jgi:hypothetical protein